MAKNKRYDKAKKEVDLLKKHTIDEAFKVILKTATAKFDESIEVAVRLGVDPKQSDQAIRGAVSLPHGLGKKVRVLVFAKGPKEIDAKNAGADYVGSEDLVEKIVKENWLEFDKVIATPDMMALLSRGAAQVLGPRGLMPSPKVGTVTMDVVTAINAEKKGKLAYRVDKAGILHASIGKKSMGEDKLKDNFMTFMAAVMKAKPSSSKGIYLKGVSLSSTMGPGVKLDAVLAANQFN